MFMTFFYIDSGVKFDFFLRKESCFPQAQRSISYLLIFATWKKYFISVRQKFNHLILAHKEKLP